MLIVWWSLPDHLAKEPSWNNFCLLSIPVINLTRAVEMKAWRMSYEDLFHRDFLGNVRISQKFYGKCGRGWVGKTNNCALRDKLPTSSLSSLAKIKEMTYMKATNKEPGIWSRHLINISSFPFPSWQGQSMLRKSF